jgi:hypothetical protein
MPGSIRMDLVKQRVRIESEDRKNRECLLTEEWIVNSKENGLKRNVLDLPISTQEVIDLKLKHEVYVSLVLCRLGKIR